MAMGSLRDNSEKHNVGLHACYITHGEASQVIAVKL